MSTPPGFERWVRPYAMTRGRTRPTRDLPIEALVIASEHPDAASVASLGPEARAILQLSTVSMSVAELAARTGLVLGVARVLVADLADADLVGVTTGADVDLGVGEAERQLSRLELLERVLDGLQSL